ncbi:MAG: YkgJ family cysteine cluster protein [Endozoicomonadaceae bacterium]|nr:YkgJ family cysteine cluster protein [Endozoicomonadaceae bacterium]
MICRIGCAACCIAPSISTAIPGMPEGKPAGVRCVQLNEQNACLLFGKPERPHVCNQFTAEASVCGKSDETAMTTLISLEELTT